MLNVFACIGKSKYLILYCATCSELPSYLSALNNNRGYNMNLGFIEMMRSQMIYISYVYIYIYIWCCIIIDSYLTFVVDQSYILRYKYKIYKFKLVFQTCFCANMSLETHAPSVGDVLSESLQFRLKPGASYATDRTSVSLFPLGGNSYAPKV